MENLPKISLQRLFEDMDDPRVVGRSTYPLVEVVMIAICAVLCGAEAWTEVEEFGESKREWLGQFLKLKDGIPSHDTFRQVFSMNLPRFSGGNAKRQVH